MRQDGSISDSVVNIQGKDRCRHGGGVAIYTRDILNVREMSQIVPENIESVCLEIKPKSKPILLSTVYLPFNCMANFMDDLENYLHTLDEQDKELNSYK